MKKLVLYVHGKGGSAEEAEHYVPLFPDADVLGFSYRSQMPWEAQKEFPLFFDKVTAGYDRVNVIANSIGAFFTLCALGGYGEKYLDKAFFISPVVNMDTVIGNMMVFSGVTEEELRRKKEIPTAFGETLSWDYLFWVRSHPIKWNVKTEILYGSTDNLQSIDVIRTFAKKHNAGLTVMDGGEHWF
ncbi:MAG: alpha/beta hydrolase, partial [Clostridia bacterium]|nr:alpha/beta hydrolase [Clostridia bacterium]